MRRVGGRGADSLHELSYHWRYDNAIVGGLGPGGRRRIATVTFQTEGPTIVCRRSMTAMLEQIRVGWNRRRRSTDPVNLLYPFEVDRIHVVRSRPRHPEIGRESCRERVCPYVSISVGAV